MEQRELLDQSLNIDNDYIVSATHELKVICDDVSKARSRLNQSVNSMISRRSGTHLTIKNNQDSGASLKQDLIKQ